MRISSTGEFLLGSSTVELPILLDRIIFSIEFRPFMIQFEPYFVFCKKIAMLRQIYFVIGPTRSNKEYLFKL